MKSADVTDGGPTHRRKIDQRVSWRRQRMSSEYAGASGARSIKLTTPPITSAISSSPRARKYATRSSVVVSAASRVSSTTSPDVSALVREILYYEPRSHCGDRLVSLLLARWGAEQSSYRIEYQDVDFSRR
jgi:hypothetical protein